MRAPIQIAPYLTMNVLEFSGLVGAGALLAGFLGALTGLGGGVIIVPLLTIALGVDIRYAIGASLVSVIATSSGAAAAYVREGFTNLRVGMLVEIATTLGAIVGATLTAVPGARKNSMNANTFPSEARLRPGEISK